MTAIRVVNFKLVLYLFTGSLLFAGALLAQGVPPSNAVAAGACKQEYAGSDTCKTCHEEIYAKGFDHTPHYKTTLKGGRGCESCHGPGAEHVAGGGDVSKIISFSKLSRQEASARCLSCHGESHEQRVFSSSSHASNDVGCLDCHSPHKAATKQFLLVKSEPGLCYGCHISAKADFSRPYRHRESQGYCVKTASSGYTAMKMLKETPVAAVLLEYKTEGMDAEAVACHIKQRFPNLPIILLSAYSGMPERILWLVDEYVMRSELSERLVRLIERAMRSAKTEEAYKLAARSNEQSQRSRAAA